MFGNDVSLPLAFGAGVMSFLTPCILPMVPVYIMYMTGVTVEEELEESRSIAITRTLGFVIGFTIIFIIMGTSASFLGKFFARNKDIFSKVSGVIISLFGLSMMDIIDIDFSKLGIKNLMPKGDSWFSSILMGMAFAAGWTPCFGPILGSILIYAGKSATLSKGIGLLLVYSLGMAIPFMLTALFINQFNRFISKNAKVFEILPKIAGLIMFIFGILVFFDKVIVISRLFI